MDILEGLLSSKARSEIFRLLFDRKGVEVYLREIQRRSGLSIAPIQAELRNLARLDLVQARRDGNRLYYSPNIEHPLYPEIHRLVEKTSGYKARLREALRGEGVEFAFIFGSVAAGRERARSDLDIFVIGAITLRQVVGRLQGLAETIGREINPHVMTVEEFRKKVRARDHFVTSLIKTRLEFLLGDEDELRKVG